ncbi:MAG TPA: hypothetical protein VKA87_00845 [Nitrososphaeraceae archaeon]|nr:hypothetical protein [Nitrososphaeraceae archaeon]
MQSVYWKQRLTDVSGAEMIILEGTRRQYDFICNRCQTIITDDEHYPELEE